MNNALHICTFKECESIIRWVCLDCVLNGIHNHFGFDYNNNEWRLIHLASIKAIVKQVWFYKLKNITITKINYRNR